MEEELIDVWHISVIPTLLGSGIRFFGGLGAGWELGFVKTQNCRGITDLAYERRQPLADRMK